MKESKYIHEQAPPLSRLIRDKNLSKEDFMDFMEKRLITGQFLKKLYLYPERCTLNNFIIVSKVTGERLDVVLRLAFEIIIPDSPFCIREDYINPRKVKESRKSDKVHYKQKKVALRNRVYQYIIMNGYSIRSLDNHTGSRTKAAANRYFANPRMVKLVDIFKVAILTKTPLHQTINFLLFGKELASTSSLWCRKEILSDLPLVLPNTSEFVENNYANIIKCTIFKDASELNFRKSGNST